MKTIVLVDDSPTILMSLSAVLGKAGYTPLTFSNGPSALAHLRGSKVDLVITDLNMPEMDGITLVGEIRKLGTCRFLPILLLTTESQQEKRAQARAAGATGWLVKPVGAEALLDVLKKVLPA